MQLPQLIRIRWAVRATLFLGMAASIAANVLHAEPNIISQLISAWPPLALLLTVELTSRVPMHRPLLAAIRVISTAVIAGIAAWVSYWHMQAVAVRFGEAEIAAYLLPISVDGLIVVASVSLVELAGRIRQVQEAQAARASTPAPAPVGSPAAAAPVAAPAAQATPAPTQAPAPSPAPVAQPVPAASAPAATAPAPEAAAQPGSANGGKEAADPVPAEAPKPVSAGGNAHGPARVPRSAPVSPAVAPVSRPARAAAAVSTPARTVVTESTTPRPRRPASETAQLADAIEAMNPGITEEELASRLNISVSRLRQVRREEAARRASLAQ